MTDYERYGKITFFAVLAIALPALAGLVYVSRIFG